MSLDTRAVENIATAPASSAERIAAGWGAAAFLVICAVTVPFGSVALPRATAVLPALYSIAVAALALTALLFYVQYRIVRSTQAALMALGYAANAVLSAFVVLTFPGVFTATGWLEAGPQTAVWLGVASQVVFGAFLIAFAVAGRVGWALDRRQVRLLALATAVLVGLLVFAADRLALPPLIAGRTVLPLWNAAIAPVVSAEMLIALVLLASGGLSTVTQVWLSLVALMYLGQAAFLNPSGGAGRFTLGWYVGRVEHLVLSSLMLAVFMVKFNDLLLRMASRTRALAQRTEVAELELTLGELRYRSLANIVPQLIWTADMAGQVEYVNDRWIAYTGLDLEETRQFGWRAAIDPAQPTSLQDAWHTSLRTGEPLRGEYRLRDGSRGRMRWFLVNALPIRDGSGAIERWIATCTDIDQSKRIEEREAFLARAGDRLSASLDVDATLATIAALVVERMAAWARVDLLDEDGHFTTVEAASAQPAEDRALQVLVGRQVDPQLEGRFALALQRRESLVEHDARELAPGVAGVRGGSAIVVPLTSGETLLGVLTLARPEPAYPDADDLAVARDFGRRAAQALDHARLYERERTTADALQRAMLPQALPQMSNVTFSASYSAASESQRVGGDFYDAFVLPDGRVALTIGDVTGHGLDAAVTMGEMRQALRASAFERADPVTILDRASQLLIASGRSLFVTAVFGVLDTRTGLFRYATAGHPSPFVFDGRRLLRLPGAGITDRAARRGGRRLRSDVAGAVHDRVVYRRAARVRARSRRGRKAHRSRDSRLGESRHRAFRRRDHEERPGQRSSHRRHRHPDRDGRSLCRSAGTRTLRVALSVERRPHGRAGAPPDRGADRRLDGATAGGARERVGLRGALLERRPPRSGADRSRRRHHRRGRRDRGRRPRTRVCGGLAAGGRLGRERARTATRPRPGRRPVRDAQSRSRQHRAGVLWALALGRRGGFGVRSRGGMRRDGDAKADGFGCRRRGPFD